MKRSFPSVVGLSLLLTLTSLPVLGQEKAPAPATPPAIPQVDPISLKIRSIVTEANTKLRAGKKSEADLKEQFDALDQLETENKTNLENASLVAYQKGSLQKVAGLKEQSEATFARIKKDYPNTRAAAQVDRMAASAKRDEEYAKIREKLTVGSQFPNFQVTDINGKPLSLENYKGKIVLVDFWAVWCGPCIKELPHVKAAYEKYHSKGFEIIGISLDPEKGKLTDFIAKEQMTWVQYLDTPRVLTAQYGVSTIPTTYLLDGEGKILAKNLRNTALDAELAKHLK